MQPTRLFWVVQENYVGMIDTDVLYSIIKKTTRVALGRLICFHNGIEV